MSIGVDFVLRASSAGFTKAMAGVNNSIHDVKKSLKEFDVGNGLKQALGVGGVIEAFRATINHAQELRDNLQKLGKPVDDATRSVAAYGDALDNIKTGIGDVAVKTLSFFTRAGEGWGMLINRLRGVSAEQEQIGENAEKAADRAQASRDRAFAKNQARSETIDKDLADSNREREMTGLSTEEKRNKLLEEREKLFTEIDAIPLRDESDPNGKVYNVARKEKQLAANKLTSQIQGLGQTMMSEQDKKDEDARRELKQAQEEDFKRAKEVRDQFAPSVEQLANMDVGGFYAKDDPRLKARQILETEKRAAMLGGRGDIAGAIKLGTEAKSMREALGNVTGQGTALTAQTAEQAFKASLEQTNKELEGLREQLKGMLKAQK